MTIDPKQLRNAESIGFVDIDSRRLAPVAAVLFRKMLVKSKKAAVRAIQVFYTGYERKGSEVSDRAKSFLQRRGFTQTDQLRVQRIDKEWIMKKDIIFAMDRFIKRDVVYNFPISNKDLESIVYILPKSVGIDERIRDPGEDYSFEIDPVFDLVEKCLEKLLYVLERVK